MTRIGGNSRGLYYNQVMIGEGFFQVHKNSFNHASTFHLDLTTHGMPLGSAWQCCNAGRFLLKVMVDPKFKVKYKSIISYRKFYGFMSIEEIPHGLDPKQMEAQGFYFSRARNHGIFHCNIC